MRAFSILFIGLWLPAALAAAQSGEAMDQGGAPEAQAAPSQSDMDAGEQSGFSRGSVVRSVFTNAIEDREPVDKVEQLQTSQREIYYFTELRDMSGQTATHRWEYNDKVVAEVEFQVKGPRWRVWSKKTLIPDWTGQWTVMVLNGAGEVISEDAFTYVEPAQTPGAASEASGNAGAAMDSEPEQ